jgi:hypothetical protein
MTMSSMRVNASTRTLETRRFIAACIMAVHAAGDKPAVGSFLSAAEIVSGFLPKTATFDTLVIRAIRGRPFHFFESKSPARGITSSEAQTKMNTTNTLNSDFKTAMLLPTMPALPRIRPAAGAIRPAYRLERSRFDAEDVFYAATLFGYIVALVGILLSLAAV